MFLAQLCFFLQMMRRAGIRTFGCNDRNWVLMKPIPPFSLDIDCKTRTATRATSLASFPKQGDAQRLFSGQGFCLSPFVSSMP